MSILESFKAILKTNKLTLVGKIFALIFYAICVCLGSLCYIAIYPIYVIAMFIYFIFTGKFHLVNLWKITDWCILEVKECEE